jgi:phage/plasmid-like protein (TIGR03299 family)
LAHLVETMAYAGATPWHGLGKKVSSDLTPAEMAQAADLTWTVSKVPIYTDYARRNAGSSPADGTLVPVNGGYHPIADRYALERSSDGRVLDIVGPVYQIVQPAEALEFFAEFVRSGGMKMDTAGSLDSGRRIWGLAEIQQGFTLAGGDRVDGYLLLCSPYRQGESFTIKVVKVRVVCNNTLTAALASRAAGNGATFRMSHAVAFDDEMRQAAKETLGLAVQNVIDFQAQSAVTRTFCITLHGSQIRNFSPKAQSMRRNPASRSIGIGSPKRKRPNCKRRYSPETI